MTNGALTRGWRVVSRSNYLKIGPLEECGGSLTYIFMPRPVQPGSGYWDELSDSSLFSLSLSLCSSLPPPFFSSPRGQKYNDSRLIQMNRGIRWEKNYARKWEKTLASCIFRGLYIFLSVSCLRIFIAFKQYISERTRRTFFVDLDRSSF